MSRDGLSGDVSYHSVLKDRFVAAAPVMQYALEISPHEAHSTNLSRLELHHTAYSLYCPSLAHSCSFPRVYLLHVISIVINESIAIPLGLIVVFEISSGVRLCGYRAT